MSVYLKEFEKFLNSGNKSLADCWKAAWNAATQNAVEICKRSKELELAEAIEREKEE